MFRRKKTYLIAAVFLALLLAAFFGCPSSPDEASFSFIYMGDPQADPETGDYSNWGELLKMASLDDTKPSLVLLGGDLVNDGNDPLEWEAFFDAGGEVLQELSLYPAMGNHDNTELFKEQFDLPSNGPKGKEGEFYSFDHGRVHFIILNSNDMGAANAEDIAWLDEDLAATDKDYIIVMFHHPAYTAVDNPKDEIRAETIRSAFIPILERYNVDLVLTGHQHVYMRTHPIKRGEIREDGIVYMMGVSGGKQYEPAERDYSAFSLGGEPVYSICTVDEGGIGVKTCDSSGNIVDSFEIGEKQREIVLSGEQKEKNLTVEFEDSGENMVFTLEELADIDYIGYEHVYSTVNNWPSPSFYAAKGFKVRRILEEVGDYEEIESITFRSSDGYEMSFTKEQLLNEPRMYFPFLKDGSKDGAVPVEPILSYAFKESTENIEDAVARPLCFIFGQKNPNEHTNPAFVEDVTHIIVSKKEAESWDAPTTFPVEGKISKGETVKLQHSSFGLVKLHYTLDGSDPTELSPMYNPSTYQPELNVPIRIDEDTLIRAIAVGYGKNKSKVAEYRFTVTN